MFIIIQQHILNDTPTGVRTVLRLTIKGQKVSVIQSLEIPFPFSKTDGIILPLISLWNYPAHKNQTPHISESLVFWDSLHSVYGVCTSLNKSVLTLLQLTLEFLPGQSRGLSLGGPSKRPTPDLGYDHPLTPHFPYNRSYHFSRVWLWHLPLFTSACIWCMLSHFSSVWLFATLWTVAHQAPLSMAFSRILQWLQEIFTDHWRRGSTAQKRASGGESRIWR